MKVIGLTGGIASGKSAVSAWLREHGIPVLDADVAAREVVRPGMPALAALAEVFGKAVLTPAGELDRKYIANVIFASPEERAKMNAIMHPAIFRWFERHTEEQRREGAALIVWDVPLLVDLGWQKYVDEVWVVRAEMRQQLERVMLRDGHTEAEARARLAAQISAEEREAAADVVIDNTGTLKQTYRQLENLLVRYMGNADEEP